MRRFGQNAGMPGSDVFRSVIEAIAVQYGAADAKMFHRFDEHANWTAGTCIAFKKFEETQSVYTHLAIAKCDVAVE
jgi:hypothetical protein